MKCCQSKANRMARAGMCATCAWNDRHCPEDGFTVAIHVEGAKCQRGRHPSSDGTIRWLGLDWIGVPYLLRWWLWSWEFNDQDPWEFVRKFPGCGCIRALKQRFDAIMFVLTNRSAPNGDAAASTRS